MIFIAGFPEGDSSKLAGLPCYLDGLCCYITAWKNCRCLAADFSFCSNGLRTLGRQHVFYTFWDCIWSKRHIFSIHHAESDPCHSWQYRRRGFLRCYHILDTIWKTGQEWSELRTEGLGGLRRLSQHKIRQIYGSHMAPSHVQL